jgi:hypothetical protein
MHLTMAFCCNAARMPEDAARAGTMRVAVVGLVRALLLAAAAASIAATPVRAASGDADALLRSLIGKDEATIEHTIGPPDESLRNGVQTYLRYRSFDSWRIGGKPDPFGYAQSYSGPLGFRGSANFDCLTTLVLTDGVLTAFARKGIGCR